MLSTHPGQPWRSPALPFTAVNADTCELHYTECIANKPRMCVPGSQGNMPMPCRQVDYFPGSRDVATTSPPCSPLPPPPDF